jgi:hypothetical protein
VRVNAKDDLEVSGARGADFELFVKKTLTNESR